ncbi:unnamed protein product [Fraxinus pennsylvanica]|uniref:GPN-loop GTPase 2 n=1 Tax=Fraxinus pennsylvanica TaxID=56036 RepID=A0AAD2A224_9LAMI|nr:unnamed protein product [Fraxinus pennsylvanica]
MLLTAATAARCSDNIVDAVASLLGGWTRKLGGGSQSQPQPAVRRPSVSSAGSTLIQLTLPLLTPALVTPALALRLARFGCIRLNCDLDFGTFAIWDFRSLIVDVDRSMFVRAELEGWVVIGPPGSGKTTYCNGMSQFLQLIGRKVAVINLDPANDALPYECAINIEDLVKLNDVMGEHSLGPNGGLVYCMDYLESNIDWLESKLKPLLQDHYLLFDFPGQVELFFLHESAKRVIMKLIKKLNLRLTVVHLVDAHLCSDPGKYVSALLLSLSTMLHLELPHVNVLSKIDLIENYGKLAFNLDFYTDVQDLSYLQQHLDQDPRSAKYRKLTKELCEVIEDYGLVNFTTLDIQDKESVGNLVKLIDKSNGYIFAGMDASAIEFSKIAVGPVDWDYYRYPSAWMSNRATIYSFI